ncbi:hypothetical protein AJ80_03723 [Polytolypa hystricis UAMH7299]|uniref:Uncharacterized protein n=1 Tax=Polytolypa hystricis (strain UAMH7299) TaxID=1447883 RepID=A0A2B7YGB1_POLH7|nr:hypothetical protein AJ80_03723 [Polytolypa hystricis UAMH7299]
MTYAESPMPGAFILDSPVPPKLDLAGARSQFYRPPQTPSAASSLCRSVGSNNHGSRKRARYGYDGGDSSTAMRDERISWANPAASSLSDVASPAPLVNTDYRFAGGLDASTAASIASFEKREYDGNTPEEDYRPTRYRDSRVLMMDSPASQSLVMHQTAGRKRSRRDSLFENIDDTHAKNDSPGWGKTVINMACKVWDFCWSGPFSGFYAGGGQGYQIQQSDPPPSRVDASWQAVHEKDDAFTAVRCQETPVPGRFSLNDGGEYSHHGNRDELRGNWVLVPNEADSRESSPLHNSRKVPRRSAPIHVTPRRTTVGRTARRQSIVPARPTSSHRPFTPNNQISYGSPKVDSPVRGPESPVSQEAQRIAAKVRRREREEDASIRRLNQQLKAMIKEGKQALGTKVEVDDEMEDWD